MNSACKHPQRKSLNVPGQFDQMMARNKKILSAAFVCRFCFLRLRPVAHWKRHPRRRVQSSQEARTPNVKPLDPSQAARVQRIMVPLLRAGDKTRSLKEIRVGVVEDPDINAANAGGGEFYVTTGLLQKANDEHLRGILAHEIAHDDLGHVAKAQVLGTWIESRCYFTRANHSRQQRITPIAGTLVARAYSRSEELAADRHGVEILQRAGYSKDVMIDSLAWVMQSSPADGGGFLSTHPATQDRIAALRQVK